MNSILLEFDTQGNLIDQLISGIPMPKDIQDENARVVKECSFWISDRRILDTLFWSVRDMDVKLNDEIDPYLNYCTFCDTWPDTLLDDKFRIDACIRSHLDGNS